MPETFEDYCRDLLAQVVAREPDLRGALDLLVHRRGWTHARVAARWHGRIVALGLASEEDLMLETFLERTGQAPPAPAGGPARSAR
jgi:hypothetical protein